MLKRWILKACHFEQKKCIEVKKENFLFTLFWEDWLLIDLFKSHLSSLMFQWKIWVIHYTCVWNEFATFNITFNCCHWEALISRLWWNLNRRPLHCSLEFLRFRETNVIELWIIHGNCNRFGHQKITFM